jgi:hypothetical protein
MKQNARGTAPILIIVTATTATAGVRLLGWPSIQFILDARHSVARGVEQNPTHILQNSENRRTTTGLSINNGVSYFTRSTKSPEEEMKLYERRNDS